MTTAESNPELRKRIDAQLDSIDRILIGANVGWSERQSIIGEVETQIFELLARRSPTPTPEDVQAVFDSLDPPEAYIPDELRGAPASESIPQRAWRHLPKQAAGLVVRSIPGATFAVALLAINGALVLIVASSQGVIPWLVTLAGILWLNVAAVRRFRAWSAKCQGRMLEDLRQRLAAWLLSNNGAPAA